MVEVNLTLVPNNYDDWQGIVTGASGGATVTNAVQYGSVNLTFVENNGGTGTLNFNALRVPFVPSDQARRIEEAEKRDAQAAREARRYSLRQAARAGGG